MTPDTVERPAARGRPARISRDAVLDAALALLEAHPRSAPSLGAIARALNITPMAIYTYFASKDDLLQALSERLLADLILVIPPAAGPLDQIRLWSHAMRGHLLKRPQLIEMLAWEGGHSSLGWLSRSVVVHDALQALGLKGTALARATLWVWQGVMGAVHAELRERAAPLGMTEQEFEALDPSLKERLGPMLALVRKDDHHASFFDFQLERLLDGVRVLTR